MLFQIDSNTKVPATSKADVAERLVDTSPTAGYRPGTPLHLFYGYGNQLPPLYLFYQELEVMLMHPQVRIALDYYKSGLASAEFKVSAKNPKVAKFVQEIFRRIWATSLGRIQESYEYGWIGAEIVYRFDDQGWLTFDTLKTFHPRDVKVLTKDFRYAGVRVINVPGSPKPVDLWGPSSGLAKGFWHAHRAKYGSLWGWSQCIASWRPWRRLAAQDGGEDIVDLAVFRYGVAPSKVYHPVGKKNVAESGRESGDPSNSQLARMIGENAKSNGSLAIPSLFDEKGNRLWDVQTPQAVLNVDSLIGYNGSLEKQISMGIGVPPELLEAAETGSGYSGRQIPLEAFIEGQQTVGRDIIQSVCEQIVKPLVKWNCGEEAAQFDVELIPLMQSRAKRQMVSGPDGSQINAVTGYADGVQRPSGPAFQMSTGGEGYDESQHPRDETGQWTMTSGEWEAHLKKTGKRAQYGPGMAGVKLAHRTHVEDALAAGEKVPLNVRKEYPDLHRAYPVSNKARLQDAAKARKESRAQWGEKAAAQGIYPKHLHDAAKELIDTDRKAADEHNEMLTDLRDYLDRFGGSHRMLAAKSKKGGKGEIEEGAAIPGFDEAIGHMATAYPATFPPGEDHESKAFRLLIAGNRKPISEEEAYDKAFRTLEEYQDQGHDLSGEDADYSGQFGDDQPWQMSSRDFLIQRKAIRDKQAKKSYRLGFIGHPQPDKENSPQERSRLAQVAGFKPGTEEYVDAVKWPLHKLHVASALKSGKDVPPEVMDEYPALAARGKSKASQPSASSVSEVMKGEPNARGGNNLFYDLPGTDYGLRVSKGRALDQAAAADFSPVDDDFPEHNFGQAVGNYGSGVELLKKQAGEPAGMPFKFDKTEQGKAAAVDKYREQTRAAAEMPDKSYDQLMQNIKTIEAGGYSFDPSKAGNLLIDKDGKKFGFVDLSKKTNKEYKHSASEVAVMLIDNARAKHRAGDPEFQKEAATIIRKVESAAKRNGVPIGEGSSYDYSKSLAGLGEPTKLSTIIGGAEPDPIIRGAIASLLPLQSRLIRQIISKLTGPDWMSAVQEMISTFRGDTIHALAVARFDAALAAMRRVVASSPRHFPVFEELVPPVASSPVAGTSLTIDVPFGINSVAESLGLEPTELPVDRLAAMEEAVSDLLGRKILAPEDFYALAADAKQQAFTVAGEQTDASLETIRQTLADALAQGSDQGEWRQAVIKALNTDPFLSPNHRETVFRTNIAAADTAGQNRVLAHPMVSDHFPYRAIYPISDGRVRPWHRATEYAGIDGTNVYRADDPTWSIIMPPSDFQCRCGWVAFTIEQAARAGVGEAQEWMRTGNPPATPARCSLPPNWQQSPEWVR